MKSLFLELWAVSSLQICPELSGGRKGGREESLFVQEERNCQRDCTDKCVVHVMSFSDKIATCQQLERWFMGEALSDHRRTMWWVGRQQDTRISKLGEDTRRVFLAQIVSYFWKTLEFQDGFILKYNVNYSVRYHRNEFDWRTIFGKQGVIQATCCHSAIASRISSSSPEDTSS